MKNNQISTALLITVISCIILYCFIQSTQFKITIVKPTQNQQQPTSGRSITVEEINKVLHFHQSIKRRERHVYSQNGEDGVIDFLIDSLNLGENYKGYFVEFGTQNGDEINTRFLRQKRNWTGLLMDGSNENPKINLHKEMILHSNVVQLFQKYKVPTDLDLFSEDTDYGDYWIVEQVMQKYSPKIVIHEINQQNPDKCVVIEKPIKLTFFDGSIYHGASICAFRCLAMRFGYTMVYCESNAINCFWMRNDLLEKVLNIDPKIAQSILTPAFLYFIPKWAFAAADRPWVHVNCSN
jgi:hypothetical protein